MAEVKVEGAPTFPVLACHGSAEPTLRVVGVGAGTRVYHGAADLTRENLLLGLFDVGDRRGDFSVLSAALCCHIKVCCARETLFSN